MCSDVRPVGMDTAERVRCEVCVCNVKGSVNKSIDRRGNWICSCMYRT